MDKKSYIETRELTSHFNEGDTVLFPIFTRGNRLAPHYGEVSVVHEGIGMLDIATPMGVIRVQPHEVIQARDQERANLPDDIGYNSWEKQKNKEDGHDEYSFAKPWKVAKSYHNNRIRPLAKKIRSSLDDHSSRMAAYDSIFDQFSGTYSDEEVKRAFKLVKNAASNKTSSGKNCLECGSSSFRRASFAFHVCDDCFHLFDQEDMQRHRLGKQSRSKNSSKSGRDPLLDQIE